MSEFSAVIDLSTLDGLTGFRIDGIDANDQSGFSVSSAGDINGDGFDDLIIGAWGADPGGDGEAGETYVVFGKASGFSPAWIFRRWTVSTASVSMALMRMTRVVGRYPQLVILMATAMTISLLAQKLPIRAATVRLGKLMWCLAKRRALPLTLTFQR